MNPVGELFFKEKKKKLLSGFLIFFLLFNPFVGFWFDNKAEASDCPLEPVTFVEDTILELDGLDTTTYIAAGSEAGELVIDGNTLEVTCIWPDSYFRLKTFSHRVLQLSPVNGPADLIFSSQYVTNGYVSRWTTVNTVAVTYTLAVPVKAAEYHVTVNGVGVSGSPFEGSSGEISFARLGSGETEVYVVTQGEIVVTFDEYGANVFGWGWSDNTGWISFNNDDLAESLAQYNRAMDHLEGWLWSDNIGWISLNCLTDDGCDETDPARQYKVSIDSQGNFSGWAWSDNLGWLSFDRTVTGNPPSEPHQASGAIARYDSSDEKIRGWARFTAAMQEGTGNWDGWIKFRCHGDECYHGWSDTKDGAGGFFVRDDDYLDGWAWGGTVVGWISPWYPSANHYGLNIDPDNSYKLRGHIWSEHIGWITFNREVAGAPPQDDVCPDGSCLGLLNIGTYELNGWARAVNYGAGWDGWIKLNGVADGTPYAPKLDVGTKHFRNWAYGGEVLGWISFNSTNEVGGPEYYVYTTLEFGLKAVNLGVEWDYCLATRHPLLVWGVEGGEQGGYLVEIYGDSGLSNLVYQYEAESITSSHRPNINAGECNVGGNGFQNEGTCNLEYTKQYWWRAKVRPAGGQFGAWSGTATFTVEHTHHWPDPDFSYNPEQVSLETKTYFDSTNSDAFGGTSINAWRWSADNVLYRYEDATSGSSQNPVIVFEQEATYKVTLEVWDSAGYGPCPLSKNINVAERSAYKWIEISPTE